MKWFSNLSPRVKLIAAFLFVSCMLSGVSLLALRQMGQLNETIKGMYSNQTLPINALGQTRSLILETIQQTQKSANSSGSLDGNVVTLSERQNDFKKYYEDIVVPQATTATENAMTVKIKDEFRTFLKQAELIESQSKSGGTGADLESFVKSGSSLLSQLDEEIDFNLKLAEEGMTVSARTYESAATAVCSLIAVCSAIALTIGWFTARWISLVLANIERLSQETEKRAEQDRQHASEQQAKVSEVLRLVNEVAQGNFELRFPNMGNDPIGQVANALNATVMAVKDSLCQVRDVSMTVSTAAEQLSSTSREIASGAQIQASNLEETASSLEEITSTIKQNSDNAQQARQLASGARDVAERGGTVVSDAVSAMQEINSSSKRIADIITTIDEIAFQTNLLALNAAVEAARAGEQGRGFAVVAAEVRNLAQRSATAAKEIKALIQDSVNKVHNGTDLVNKSGETLNEIVVSVKRVADIVCEIAAASKEQLSGVEQVNKAITQMDRVTQGNAAQTEEMSSTSAMLLQHARVMSENVGRFRLGKSEAGTRSVARTTDKTPTTTSEPAAIVAPTFQFGTVTTNVLEF